MAQTQAAKQSADYRAAAASYAASGNTSAAEALTELANRIDATLLMQARKGGAA